MLAEETLDDPVDAGRSRDDRAASSRAPHARRRATRPSGVHRIGLVAAPATREQRFIGLGARHGLHVDQAGRSLQLGADRALHRARTARPTCSSVGGIPQGDYAPVPWVLLDRGWAAWLETRRPRACASSSATRSILSSRARRRAAARPPVHAPDARRAAARVPAADRAARRCCPSGPTGTGRAATSTSTSATSRPTTQGYREHGLPLDAIVLDSPWATQYNTWEFNPHQFPDARGYDRAAARATACGPSCGSRRG